MSQEAITKEYFHYSNENVFEDPDWAYLMSYKIISLGPKENMNLEKSFSKMKQHQIDTFNSKESDFEINDKNLNILDLGKETFQDYRKKRIDYWEKQLQETCFNAQQ